MSGDEPFAPVELFVGPPGAGKTTTIAKIAARERAQRGRRLSLLAADGFRVGAVEQLRLYADLIGSPFAVARTPAEIERSLAATASPILVDTAGRSIGDARALEVAERLSSLPGVRTHVVLPAGSSIRQAARLLDAYGARARRVVLTRLDEGDSVAPLLKLIAERDLHVVVPGDGTAGPGRSRTGERRGPRWTHSRTGRPGGARGMSAEQQSSVGKRNRQGRPAAGTRASAPPPAAAVETDRNQLVIDHVGLVKAMAHRLAQRLPSQVEMNELISVGVVGLIDAADRYKPALGVPFDAFARRRVQGAMLDALRELDWAPRSLRRMRRDLDQAIAELRHDAEARADRGRSRRRDVDVAGRVRQVARPDPHAGSRRHPPARRDRRGRLAAARAVPRSGRRARRAAAPHRAADAARPAPSASCPSASARSWRSTTRKS